MPRCIDDSRRRYGELRLDVAVRALILIGGDVFKFFKGFVEGGLLIIDDLARAMQAFDPSDGEGYGAQVNDIFIMGHLSIIEGIGDAGEVEAEQGFFVVKLTLDITVKAIHFRLGKGTDIESVLEGIVVPDRSAALARGFGIGRHERIIFGRGGM
jgi:hypothetical protein